MSDTPRTPSSDPKNLGSSVNETTSGVAREAREFASGATGRPKTEAGRAAQSTVDQASSALSSGMDTAQARLQDLQEWTHQTHETARERIREHPVTYCIMAFAGGMLMGLLLNRR